MKFEIIHNFSFGSGESRFVVPFAELCKERRPFYGKFFTKKALESTIPTPSSYIQSPLAVEMNLLFCLFSGSADE